MALNSIISLRKHNPDIIVCVITNVSEFPPSLTSLGKIIWRYVPVSNQSNRNIKTRLIDYTEFNRSLYLDCDTLVNRDIFSGFFLLDYFDVAVRPHPTRKYNDYKGQYTIFGNTQRLSELPHWNSAVIFFKAGDNTQRFFSKWNSSYETLGIEFDQASLVEAFFLTPVRVCPLDSTWNCSYGGFVRTEDKNEVFVIHYASDIVQDIARDLTKINNQLDNYIGKDVDNEVFDFITARRSARKRKNKPNSDDAMKKYEPVPITKLRGIS